MNTKYATIMKKRNELLRSVGGAALATLAMLQSGGVLAAPTYTDPSVSTDSTSSITVLQQYNSYTSPTANLALGANTGGSVTTDITSNNASTYSVTAGTLTVGSSASTGNTSAATGYANTATVGIAAIVNAVTGSGYASASASSDSGNASTPTGASATGISDLAISVTQQNKSTEAVVTDTVDMGITLDNGASGSTLLVDGNTQSATGVLNNGSTTIATDVNTASSSSAITSSQSSVDAVIATSVKSLDQVKSTGGGGGASNALLNSTVSVSDNTQSAITVANESSNTQSITGNALTLAGEDQAGGPLYTGTATTGTITAEAVGAYATASKQELIGGSATTNELSAIVDDTPSGSAGFLVSMGGNVSGSTINSDSNSASAVIRGNEVNNVTTLTANTITTKTGASVDPGTVAAIASQQDISGKIAINAEVLANSGPAVLNTISGNVSNSTVTASDNTVSADAVGNRGGNHINAYASSIDTSGDYVPTAVASSTTATSNAAFAVASRQTTGSDATINAFLTDDGSPGAATSIQTTVGGDVSNSTMALDGNRQTASATGNLIMTGSNSITLAGAGGGMADTLATTAVVTNLQSNSADINAYIGFDPAVSGSAPLGGVIFDMGGDLTGSTVTVNGNVTAGSATANAATNRINASGSTFGNSGAITGGVAALISGTARADNALTSSQIMGSASTVTSDVGAMFAARVDSESGDSDVSSSSISVSDNSLASAATGNTVGNTVNLTANSLSSNAALANIQSSAGDMVSTIENFSGANVTVAYDVAGSTFDVERNTLDGSVLGNGAINEINVASSSITAGDATSGGTAIGSTSATADYALASSQSLTSDASLTSNVGGTYDIATLGLEQGATPGASGPQTQSNVTSSSLSVSDNTQRSTILGNSATNTVALSGSSLTTDAALASSQSSAAAATSTSTMTVKAPAANDDSSLAMDGNSNSSDVTSNYAVNALTATGTSALNASAGGNATLTGSSGTAAADFALANVQSTTSGAPVGAIAITTVGNSDNSGFKTDGINGSSVSVSGNSSLANGYSNRATNTVSLTADSESASAGLLNEQTNAATVGALSQFNAYVDVTNDGTAVPVTGSSVTLSNNTAASRAGGNTATNVMNVSVATLSNTAANSTAGVTSAGAVTAGANFAVLNNQANTAGMTATTTVNYHGAFDTTGAAVKSLNDSAVVLNGNVSSAVAYANAANNTLRLAALNGSAAISSAVVSNQSNTGTVNATVSSINYVDAYHSANAGTLSNSSVSIGNTALGAQAVGNSVTNTMTLGGNAMNFTAH